MCATEMFTIADSPRTIQDEHRVVHCPAQNSIVYINGSWLSSALQTLFHTLYYLPVHPHVLAVWWGKELWEATLKCLLKSRYMVFTAFFLS